MSRIIQLSAVVVALVSAVACQWGQPSERAQQRFLDDYADALCAKHVECGYSSEFWDPCVPWGDFDDDGFECDFDRSAGRECVEGVEDLQCDPNADFVDAGMISSCFEVWECW